MYSNASSNLQEFPTATERTLTARLSQLKQLCHARNSINSWIQVIDSILGGHCDLLASYMPLFISTRCGRECRHTCRLSRSGTFLLTTSLMVMNIMLLVLI